MKKKRILIMTASVGSGHIKAAEAIMEKLAPTLQNCEIRMIDFMDREVSVVNWLLKKLYLKMLAFVPNLYDLFYKVSGDGSGGAFAQNMFSFIMYRTMKEIIETFEPIAIICTHPFPEGTAAMSKRRGAKNFFLAAVLTDYSLHKIWIYPEVDFYFTATEEMKTELIAQGFSANQIAACGIPVRDDILSVPEKSVVRRELGINETDITLLIMGGGLGLGGIETTMTELEKINRNLFIIVVAGKNDVLKEAMIKQAAHSHHKIKIFGYTDRVSFLMKASDAIITKPGALTISEAFAAGLPLILHEPIPGPEAKNASYAVERGAAVWVKGKNIGSVIEDVIFSPQKLDAMRKAALDCARLSAATEIAKAARKKCFEKR